MTTDRRITRTPQQLQALEERFALRAAAMLSEKNRDAFPADISERLRVAREQAAERARARRPVTSKVTADVVMGSTLALGSGPTESFLWRGLSWLPLFALIGGLFLINEWQGSNEIRAAAEVDASLLADDLPPSAYADAGFLEFLKSAQD